MPHGQRWPVKDLATDVRRREEKMKAAKTRLQQRVGDEGGGLRRVRCKGGTFADGGVGVGRGGGVV